MLALVKIAGEIQRLRREVVRLETINEALIDAGRAVIVERDKAVLEARELFDVQRRLREERDNWHAAYFAERRARLAAQEEVA